MKYNLNKTQVFYYKRAIIGLRIYTPDQLYMITSDKKNRIKRVHKKAKSVIQLLRYQRLVKKSNSILTMYFSQGNVYNELMQETITFTSPDLDVTLNDITLDITKDDIIKYLLESGVLGPNFLNLK
jgi:hypothetical protein